MDPEGATVVHPAGDYDPITMFDVRLQLMPTGSVFSMHGRAASKVPIAVSDSQHNMFTHNSYSGPWHFDVFCQGILVNWQQWTHGLTVRQGANKHLRGQETGSKLNGHV